MDQILLDLNKGVESLRDEESGYFCYENSYCEFIGCNGSEKCTLCEGDGFGLTKNENCVQCDGDGFTDDPCDNHFGSVLSVEHHYNGDNYDVTVVVGTGGPHYELDTRTGTIHGYWAGKEAKRFYDKDKCNEVRQYWESLHRS